MRNMSAKNLTLHFFIILAFGLLVGCSANVISTAHPTALPPNTTHTPTAEVLSPTPESKIPVVLVQRDSKILSEELSSWLEETVRQQGWSLEISDLVAEESLTDATRLVVLFHSPENLTALLDKAPETTFIVFSPAPLPETPNLIQVITPLPQVYFLSGYLSVLVAPDFRAGALLPQEPSLNDEATQAFLNGAYYLCGRCVPVYGPIVVFPLTASLPEAAPEETWRGALEELNKNRLESLFIDARIATSALYEYLDTQNWMLLGNQTPPASLEDRWVATIAFDYGKALENAWQIALRDEKSAILNAPLGLYDVNPALLSPGRQKMAEKIITALQNGSIYPLTPP